MTPIEHYYALFAGYGALVAATLALNHFFSRSKQSKPIWPAAGRPELKRPWTDLGLIFLAVIAVIGVGQLYTAGYLLPTSGELGPWAEALNQLIIFSPIPLLLLIRQQPPSTALLPMKRLPTRLAAGVGLALLAGVAYSAVARDFALIPGAIADEAAAGRLPAHAVQVLMEDLAIAALLVRLAAAIRSEWAAGALVATLFAASHIPAMLSGGEALTSGDAVRLALDVAIGLIVMVGLLKSRDLLWLYPTHLLLDVAQFAH